MARNLRQEKVRGHHSQCATIPFWTFGNRYRTQESGKGYKIPWGAVYTPSPTLVTVTGPKSPATVTGFPGGQCTIMPPFRHYGPKSLVAVTGFPGEQCTTTPSPTLEGFGYRAQESGYSYQIPWGAVYYHPLPDIGDCYRTQESGNGYRIPCAGSVLPSRLRHW